MLRCRPQFARKISPFHYQHSQVGKVVGSMLVLYCNLTRGMVVDMHSIHIWAAMRGWDHSDIVRGLDRENTTHEVSKGKIGLGFGIGGNTVVVMAVEIFDCAVIADDYIEVMF